MSGATVFPEQLVPTWRPAPVPRTDLELFQAQPHVLRFESQLGPPERPQSVKDLVERLLEELKGVGDLPHVTEMALWARWSRQPNNLLTVKGEWEISGNVWPQEAKAEIEIRIQQGIQNAFQTRGIAEARSLIEQLSQAAEVGEEDAIEFVYRHVHQLLENGDFEVLDRFLRLLDVDNQMNSVLLSLLTATAMSEVKPRISSRAAFYERTRDRLINRESALAAEELLFGLE